MMGWWWGSMKAHFPFQIFLFINIQKIFWSFFSISLPFSYFWLKYNGGVLGFEMEMLGMGWGRESVLFRSIWVKKNDPAWTGDPVDARSLYLFFAGFYRLFKFVLFRLEENNQLCPSTRSVTRQTEIFSKGQLFVSCPSHNIPIKPYTSPLLF